MTNQFKKLANEIFTELNKTKSVSFETTCGTLRVEILEDEFSSFVQFTCNGQASTMTMSGGADRFAAHLDSFLYFKCGFNCKVEIFAGEERSQYVKEESGKWGEIEAWFSAEQGFTLAVNGIIALEFAATKYTTGSAAKFQRFPFTCMIENRSQPFRCVELNTDEGDRRNPASLIHWN